MGYYNPISKIVYNDDNTVRAFANDYGSITVINKQTKMDPWSNDAARKIITDMDKRIDRRHVPQVGKFR